jgi:hypothetical protein
MLKFNSTSRFAGTVTAKKKEKEKKRKETNWRTGMAGYSNARDINVQRYFITDPRSVKSVNHIRMISHNRRQPVD